MSVIVIPNILKTAPVLTDFGRISDPDGFSGRGNLYGQDGKDLHIRRAGASLDLTDVPQNFHAVINQSLSIHDLDKPEQKDCMLHINQGRLEPNKNFRVISPHFDPLVRRYPDNLGVMEDSFIISDTLTTAFYLQAFDVPDYCFAPIEDIYWQLSNKFKEQADPAKRFMPEPYHLIRFSAYAVHESQLPAVATDRTFALMRFF